MFAFLVSFFHVFSIFSFFNKFLGLIPRCSITLSKAMINIVALGTIGHIAFQNIVLIYKATRISIPVSPRLKRVLELTALLVTIRSYAAII